MSRRRLIVVITMVLASIFFITAHAFTHGPGEEDWAENYKQWVAKMPPLEQRQRLCSESINDRESTIRLLCGYLYRYRGVEGINLEEEGKFGRKKVFVPFVSRKSGFVPFVPRKADSFQGGWG